MRHEHMMELARHGAAIRLAELEKERTHLERFLSTLDGRKNGIAKHLETALRTASAEVMDRASGTRTRRRSKMSAAARKAVSKRMKAYWAERRTATK